MGSNPTLTAHGLALSVVFDSAKQREVVHTNPTLTAREENINMKNNQIVISGAVVFKENNGKKTFLVVKISDDAKWEIPKVTVRRGESSIRAALRMTGEMAGMNARVLEEAFRTTGSAIVNGRTVSQKFYYYLMMQRAGGEVLGFSDYKWMELSRARSAVHLKREKDVFKNAKEVLKIWEKSPRNKKEEEPELPA